jgi:large subunit ribosomal protein L29
MPMQMKEILEKQGDQLSHELIEQQKHLFDLRSQAVTEKLEDPSQLRKTRKTIARMKTVLRQRQLEQQRETEKAKAAEAGAEARQKPGEPAQRPGADAPAFGRKTRVNAVKQKVRARRTGGGKTAARKVKARKAMYKTRRRGKAANAR